MVPTGLTQDPQQTAKAPFQHTGSQWVWMAGGGKEHPGPWATAKCTNFVEVALLVASLITSHLHPSFAGKRTEQDLPTPALPEPSRLVDGHQQALPGLAVFRLCTPLPLHLPPPASYNLIW